MSRWIRFILVVILTAWLFFHGHNDQNPIPASAPVVSSSMIKCLIGGILAFISLLVLMIATLAIAVRWKYPKDKKGAGEVSAVKPEPAKKADSWFKTNWDKPGTMVGRIGLAYLALIGYVFLMRSDWGWSWLGNQRLFWCVPILTIFFIVLWAAPGKTIIFPRKAIMAAAILVTIGYVWKEFQLQAKAEGAWMTTKNMAGGALKPESRPAVEVEIAGGARVIYAPVGSWSEEVHLPYGQSHIRNVGNIQIKDRGGHLLDVPDGPNVPWPKYFGFYVRFRSLEAHRATVFITPPPID